MAPLKNIGLLLGARSYFIPYVEWLFSQDGLLYNIVGCVDNDTVFDAVPGYVAKKERSVETLASRCDVMLSLGYCRILSKPVLDAVPDGVLNIHHSYLLRYRGRHATTWVLLNGEKTHGTTIHFMTERLDDGPILSSREVPIREDDTAGSLFRRVNEEGFRMMKEALPRALTMSASERGSLPKPDPDHRVYRQKDLVTEIPAHLLGDPAALLRHVRALTYPGAPAPYVRIANHKLSLVLSGE